MVTQKIIFWSIKKKTDISLQNSEELFRDNNADRNPIRNSWLRYRSYQINTLGLGQLCMPIMKAWIRNKLWHRNVSKQDPQICMLMWTRPNIPWTIVVSLFGTGKAKNMFARNLEKVKCLFRDLSVVLKGFIEKSKKLL